MSNRTLGLIPARGGSKRVHNKNIRNVAGKPLLAHTIEQANDAAVLEETIVSTDDDRIAEVAQQYGGDIPFSRPEELATDTASSSSVVTHALDWFEERGKEFDAVCLLQVTSPLRMSADIDRGIKALYESNAETLVSVTEYTEPPQYALHETDDGFLEEHFEPELLFDDEYVREQDLSELLYPNGALFAADVGVWRQEETFYTDRTQPLRMPPERSIQIDEEWELEMVDAYMKSRSEY